MFSEKIEGITKYKQLISTAFIAVVIVSSFLYISNSFINTTKKALEDGVSLRIATLHDGLAPFVSFFIGDKNELSKYLKNIPESVEGVKEVSVIEKQADGDFRIISSSDFSQEGVSFLNNKIIFYADRYPGQSVQYEISSGGIRYFEAMRKISKSGNLYIYSLHSLTESEKYIENSINRTTLILFVVIVFVLILFLRHARIIDYFELYKKLKQIDQMKDDFVSMVSHDLKSPLGVIRGYVEILRDTIFSEEIKSKIDSKTLLTLKETLERIDNSAKRLLSMVEDILDVSRLQQGRMKFDIKKIDISSPIKEIVKEFEIQAKNKGLKFSYVIEPVIVFADEKKVEQIAANIISNAIKYTNSGSIKIALKKEGGKAIFSVKDTGEGMTQEQIKHLFDKFWRAKEVSNIKGTGLGMWITKQLVEKMGGKIRVHSEKGIGTEITIEFPVAN